MSFGYKDVGTFASEQDAVRWARDNNIDLQDLKTSGTSDGTVRASVRNESASGQYQDRPGGRRDGFFD